VTETVRDLRQSLRAIVRRPAATLIALLTLSIGIGANAAIFTVLNAVLLRPLPYRNAEGLVCLFASETRRGEQRNPTSPADFLEWKKASRSLDGLTAAHPWSPVLTGRGHAEELPALKASPSLFDLLGVEPAMGRVFHESEDEAQVVLSHALWQRRFGGDPAVIGQSLALDGRSYRIAAVMPPGFRFPPFWATGAELWAPLVFTPEQQASHSHFLRVFGRLHAGATLEQAQAELGVVGHRLASEWPEHNAGITVNVEALQEPVVSRVRPALLVLAGAVTLVLLIACANVTSLLLAQGLSREKEVALRAALGATRGRLVRQWLTESLALAFLGGLGGLLLARWGVVILRALAPDSLPRVDEIAVDGRVLVFTIVVSAVTGILFGLLPALRASRSELVTSLKQGERGTSGGRQRWHDALVVAEFALAVILLVGAGLLMKSFLLLQAPRAGFRSDRLLTVTLSLSGSPWAEPARRPAFFREVVERVRALPGVDGAGFVNHLPIAGDTWGTSFTVEGRPDPVPGEAPQAVMRTVSPDYLDAMGIPVIRGRGFTVADRADATRVVLVNQTLARRLWGEADPVGARVRRGGPESTEPWLQVAGVVGDALQSSVAEPVRPELLFPYAQDPVGWFKSTTLVVHTPAEPRALAASIQQQVWALGPELPVTRLRTMREILAESIGQDRFNTLLLGLLAAVAVLLAAVGIYGMMAYSVGSRSREIGLRMALGARAGEVLAMVMGQGLRLSLLGAALGLAGALALSRVLVRLLHGVSPTDPWTFAAVAGLLMAVSALASFLPARRAARVDPLVALRE
jgi:putative ABC transport system permease protein